MTDENVTANLGTEEVDPNDRVVTLHGPVIRGLERFKVFMVAAILVLGASNAGVLAFFRYQRAESCHERNEQITAQNQANEASRKFLRDVAMAMHADGDRQTAHALDDYIAQTEHDPQLQPVRC
jgi:hypothetical protein